MVGGVGRVGWWWVVVVVVSKASLTPPCEECETLETVKHHFSLPIQPASLARYVLWFWLRLVFSPSIDIDHSNSK